MSKTRKTPPFINPSPTRESAAKILGFNKEESLPEELLKSAIKDAAIDSPHFFKHESLTSSKVNEFVNQIEDVIIEGLKRKGYTFEDRDRLEFFIKEKCRCEHNKDSNISTYYVNDTPFLKHKHNSLPKFKISEEDHFSVSVNLGEYIYL